MALSLSVASEEARQLLRKTLLKPSRFAEATQLREAAYQRLRHSRTARQSSQRGEVAPRGCFSEHATAERAQEIGPRGDKDPASELGPGQIPGELEQTATPPTEGGLPGSENRADQLAAGVRIGTCRCRKAG